MKIKLLCLIVVLAIAFGVKAQGTYFNYWDSTTEVRRYLFGNGSNIQKSYFTDYFDGDTIINGKYYYRQFSLQIDTVFNYNGSIYVDSFKSTIPDYVRETHDLVFLVYNDYKKNDDTIFDNRKVLNVNLGDTIGKYTIYWPCSINKVDSIYWINRNLKRISDSSLFSLDTMLNKINCKIEGIGDIHHLCSVTADADYWINCVKKQNNEINLYPKIGCESFLIPNRKFHFTNISLPLRLINFRTDKESERILLNWQTTTETNTSHFNIQRSTNGKDFTTIGKVNAKGASTYTFNDPLTTDDSRFTKLFYRLQIVDKDGALSYSEVRELSIINSSLSISPNPAKDFVTISGTNLKQVKLLDNLGRVVAVKEATNSSTVSIPVSHIAKGIYMVQATFKDGSIKTEKVMVE